MKPQKLKLLFTEWQSLVVLVLTGILPVPCLADQFTISPSNVVPGGSAIISGQSVQPDARVVLWGDAAVVGSLPVPGIAHDVEVADGYAYVAAGDAGLQVVDVSDPTNPFLGSSLALSGRAVRLIKRGSVLYLAIEAGGMAVVDVSNPLAPVLQSSMVWPGAITGISESNSHAHVVGNKARLSPASRPELESLIFHIDFADRAKGLSGADINVSAGGTVTLAEVQAGELIVPSTSYSIDGDFGALGGTMVFPGGSLDGPVIVGARGDLKSQLNFSETPAIIAFWILGASDKNAGSMISVGPNGPNASNRAGWSVDPGISSGGVIFRIARRNNPAGGNCKVQIGNDASQIIDGKRHFIVAVYDPLQDEIYTYIDGAKGHLQKLGGCRADTDGDDSGSLPGVDQDWLTIGESGQGSGIRQYFDGSIEDLMIFTPAQIPLEIDAIVRHWYTLGRPALNAEGPL